MAIAYGYRYERSKALHISFNGYSLKFTAVVSERKVIVRFEIKQDKGNGRTRKSRNSEERAQ
jgi:hypothetical protein